MNKDKEYNLFCSEVSRENLIKRIRKKYEHHSEKIKIGIIEREIEELIELFEIVFLPYIKNPHDEEKRDHFLRVYEKNDNSTLSTYLQSLLFTEGDIQTTTGTNFVGWYLYIASEGFFNIRTGKYEYPLLEDYDAYRNGFFESIKKYKNLLLEAVITRNDGFKPLLNGFQEVKPLEPNYHRYVDEIMNHVFMVTGALAIDETVRNTIKELDRVRMIKLVESTGLPDELKNRTIAMIQEGYQLIPEGVNAAAEYDKNYMEQLAGFKIKAKDIEQEIKLFTLKNGNSLTRSAAPVLPQPEYIQEMIRQGRLYPDGKKVMKSLDDILDYLSQVLDTVTARFIHETFQKPDGNPYSMKHIQSVLEKNNYGNTPEKPLKTSRQSK